MTPKEKARHLIKSMYKISLTTNISIASAIVIAEELHEYRKLNFGKDPIVIDGVWYEWDYYEQVKSEIKAFDVNEIYDL
jgi:hypothetical protein